MIDFVFIAVFSALIISNVGFWYALRKMIESHRLFTSLHENQSDSNRTQCLINRNVHERLKNLEEEIALLCARDLRRDKQFKMAIGGRNFVPN